MKLLASDAGVRVFDYRCAVQPGDTPFEERHIRHSLAFVQSGSFGCRARGLSVELVPGSVFVGYPDDTYVCSHEHHEGGDRCIVFDFDAPIADEAGGGDLWRCTVVPPRSPLAALAGLAASALHAGHDIGLPELGLMAASRFARLEYDRVRTVTASARDRRRAVETAMLISELSDGDLRLASLASAVGLSAFHFLRTFAAVFGVTPHQYLITCRLRRAAELLSRFELPVTEVALTSGFRDLSNFIRTFKRTSGWSPSEFRRLSREDRKILQSRLGPARPD